MNIEILIIFLLILLILFYIFRKYKINNYENFKLNKKITTIITTCCRNSTPDISIIFENIKNLKKYSPKLIENLI